MSSEPLLTFGLIADVQYADKDDGSDFSQTRIRHYRNSLNHLKNAVTHWQQSYPNLNFILQLGDQIDGSCRHIGSSRCLKTALGPFVSYGKPVYHVIGNHELYNFSREELKETELFSPARSECKSPPGCFYYSFQPHPSVRFVALDCYEVSLLGYAESSEMYQHAYEIIRQINRNENLNSPAGLDAEHSQFVMWNGGVSSKQLRWLDSELQKAEELKQNTIIFGHSPIYADACFPVNLCWNAGDILDVVRKHSCVVSYICGHDHDGGDAVDRDGVLHLVLPGIIERSSDENSFATAFLSHKSLEIVGQGLIRSFTVNLPYEIE